MVDSGGRTVGTSRVLFPTAMTRVYILLSLATVTRNITSTVLTQRELFTILHTILKWRIPTIRWLQPSPRGPEFLIQLCRIPLCIRWENHSILTIWLRRAGWVIPWEILILVTFRSKPQMLRVAACISPQ